ncbi:hypothetical protein BBP40_006658 [Aspergillus hancockii]|nr:hypothetical protein BBP40_006658 [Aspergillus hancockii]
MTDAQRSHEQAAAGQRTIEILENRLKSTALAQAQVKLSEQQTEINELQQQLSQSRQGIVWPSEQVNQEDTIRKLQEALGTEKRARTEDRVRWGKGTRELEEVPKAAYPIV